MFAVEMLKTIAELRSLARLDAIAKDVWAAWAAGAVVDDQAHALSEAVRTRKEAIRGDDRVFARAPHVAAFGAVQAGQGRAGEGTSPSNSIFSPKRRPKSPDRQRSIARRRRLAASGPLPPPLAAQFTTGQLAVLRIIADEVESRRGTCALTIGELAARAGVCTALARNAIRIAERLFLISTEFRKRSGKPHLPSVIRIISKAWNAWLIIGPKVKRHAINAEREAGTLPFRSKALLGKGRSQEIIGSRKLGPTGTDFYKSALLSCGRPLTEAAQRPFGRPSAVA
jgi:hypothetical protein